MITTQIRGRAGLITLERPEALNALNMEMALEIRGVLNAWCDNDEVALVVIRGAGDRAFCAGGDIATLYHNAKDHLYEGNDEFFATEYALNQQIAEYPKPYVAFMDGVVLGGGLGLSAHGTHRIVTERSRIGMPEVGIGLFPDVGISWILARAPHRLGLHLLLSGMHVGAADAIEVGLADWFVPSDQLDSLFDALSNGNPDIITEFATTPPPGLDADRSQVADAYDAETVEAVVKKLRALAAEWATKSADSIERSCPTSVKVAFEAHHRAVKKTLSELFAQDLALAASVGRRADFVEGVRAQIIDKDRKPSWNPATLAEVTGAQVTELFEGA